MVKTSRFIDEHTIDVMRRVETVTPPADVCHQLGRIEARFYHWQEWTSHAMDLTGFRGREIVTV